MVHLFNDGIKEFNLLYPEQALPLVTKNDFYAGLFGGTLKMSRLEFLVISWLHLFPGSSGPNEKLRSTLRQVYEAIIATKPMDQTNSQVLTYYKWLISRMLSGDTLMSVEPTPLLSTHRSKANSTTFPNIEGGAFKDVPTGTFLMGPPDRMGEVTITEKLEVSSTLLNQEQFFFSHHRNQE